MAKGLKFSSYFLILTLLAIFVRSLIPVGFMPNISASKTYALTICSGLTTKTIYVHEDGKTSGHEKSVTESCPFSMPTLSGAPEIFNAVEYASFSYEKFQSVAYENRLLSRTVLKSWFAQGPPEYFAV